MSRAAVAGKWNVLRWLYPKYKDSWDNTIKGTCANFCARHGALNFLKWVVELPGKINYTTLQNLAAQNGQTRILLWLHENRKIDIMKAAQAALKYEQTDCFESLWEEEIGVRDNLIKEKDETIKKLREQINKYIKTKHTKVRQTIKTMDNAPNNPVIFHTL